MKHTKGEWVAEFESAYSGGSIFAIDDNKREYICTTSGNAKANAQLISAAPDLLEACELAEDMLFGLKSRGVYVDNKEYLSIQKAINKATGEK